MEELPRKPKILSEKESLAFIRAAKGSDISHSLSGSVAAQEQIGKGPEQLRQKKISDINKFLVRMFEKELVVEFSTDKLIEKYERYMNLYEIKAKLLNRKENELYILEENINDLKEKIKATKDVDLYIKKNKPELYENEHEKMDREREKLSVEDTMLKNKKRELKKNIELDKKGLSNLQKEIVNLAQRDDIIQIQKN